MASKGPPVTAFDIDEILPEAAQRPHVPHTIRVIRAARAVKHGALANKIEKCRKGCRCGSYWCPTCRHASAKGLETRLRQCFARFDGDYESARKDLRWVTILHDVVPLHLFRIKESMKSGKQLLHTMKRAFPGIWAQGAWELELIDRNLLMKCEVGAGSVKRETLTAMIADKVEKAEQFVVLVHCHMIVDLNGHDPVTFRRWAARKKPWKKHRRQIDVRSIWELETQLSMVPEGTAIWDAEKAALDNLAWKLSSYPFKDRVQFNKTFKTGDYEGGGFIPDMQLTRFVQIHDTLGKKVFLIGIGG